MGGEIEKRSPYAVHVTLDSPTLACLNDFIYTVNVPVVRTWALSISLLSRLGYTVVHPRDILWLGDFAGPGHLPRQVTFLYAGDVLGCVVLIGLHFFVVRSRSFYRRFFLTHSNLLCPRARLTTVFHQFHRRFRGRKCVAAFVLRLSLFLRLHALSPRHAGIAT